MRMLIHVKGKAYKGAVRPAMINGAECWSLNKHPETYIRDENIKVGCWRENIGPYCEQLYPWQFQTKAYPEKIVKSRL